MIRIISGIAISLALSVLSAEVVVRIAGLSPVERSPAAPEGSSIDVADHQLGWYNRPNVKQWFRTPGQPPHQVTILERGDRATSSSLTSDQSIPRRDVIFIGCSFTHGFGLNDQETFAWKVQAARPDWAVHNFGVNGYGTCQSYMLLKRLFERNKWRKPVVIYGFIDDHEGRNVADYIWHYSLSTLSSTGNVALPSCMLNGFGAIVFNAPHPYPLLPLRHTLAAVPILEKAYLKFVGASLAGQRRRVTEQLLIELEAFSAAQSGDFGVLFFNAADGRKSEYQQFLERRGIKVIDLYRAGQKFTAPITLFDGHPNGRMTDLIAERVVEFVSSLANDETARGSKPSGL